MKKKLCFILSFIIIGANIFTLPVHAATTPPLIKSKSAYLYNIDTQKVISEENADEAMHPAYLTQVMTCILALEQTTDLDNTLVTYPNYVQDYLYEYQRKNGNVPLAGMLAGEELSMRALLYAMMLRSANEAAMVIADYLGGSQETFVVMMNARAKELGANSTNFVNANGLDVEGHVSTARDIALITKHAMTLPAFMEIAGATSYETGATNKHENLVWETRNLMIKPNDSYYYPALKGIKAGTSELSGRCFVSSATRDGFTYLLVVMGGEYLDKDGKAIPQNVAFDDTKSLYDWVFDTYKVKSLVEKGKVVTEIKLELCMNQDNIKVMTDDRYTYLIDKDIDIASVELKPEVPASISAPVKKGAPIGKVNLVLSGEVVGTVNLVAAESVEASQVLVFLAKVKNITKSFWFKFIIVFIVSLIVLYIVLMIIRNRNRRRFSGYKPRRRL